MIELEVPNNAKNSTHLEIAGLNNYVSVYLF